MTKIKFTDYLKDGVSNKYELIMLRTQRVKEMNNGAPTVLEKGNHKNTVIACTEVENAIIDISKLRENLIKELQKELKDDELQEIYDFEEEDEYSIEVNILDPNLEDISENQVNIEES